MRRRPARRSLALVVVLLFVVVGATATVGLGSAGPINPSTDGETDDGAAVDGAERSGGAEAGEPCDFPYSLTDATGADVAVDADPERVVALQPSAAQTMWEIGAREEVVGMPVNQYTSYLEGHERPTNVVAADDFTVNVEVVVDLEPDLVLSPNVTSDDTVRQLREAGLTVYHFEAATTLADVEEKTRLTGRLTGNCEGAEERADWMVRRLGRVRDAVGDEPRPSVVYPLGGGVVAGSETFLHDVITTAGGSNLAAEAGISGYGQISAEVIVAEDPQWLIVNEGLPRSAIQMDAYNETTAVEEGQVVRVNPNYANQPAPRVVYVVEHLARVLHPEAMADADGAPVEDGPNATEPSPVTETPTAAASPETAAPGQPGFGLAAGLLAVAVALLATTRRPT